jgi:hypothetical protein
MSMTNHNTTSGPFASCRRATELISKAQDAPLSWKDGVALRLHLLLCKWCRRYEKQIRILRNVMALRRADDDAGSAALPDEARERIRRALTP